MSQIIIKNQKINCFKCKFYYVTWEKNFPYGCKAIGFKGRELPSVSVKRNTGIDCQFYEEKGTLK